jgi:protein-L-isoaspartate(D-aspartate) O-methyltransferase
MRHYATRESMVATIRREVHDPRVLDAFSRVPRELFVPPELRMAAYEDRPLPIGQDQTISQPLIVAVMTEALAIKPGDRVLEIGTGSGYQAAILAQLAGEVVSVERFPDLQEAAARNLQAAGISNVRLEPAPPDTLGFPEAAPYDAIVVTAAAPMVPRVLLDQLADGGRLVIPVGQRTEQQLVRVTRHGDRYMRQTLGPCRFVPLIGPGAWPDHGETPEDLTDFV